MRNQSLLVARTRHLFHPDLSVISSRHPDIVENNDVCLGGRMMTVFNSSSSVRKNQLWATFPISVKMRLPLRAHVRPRHSHECPDLRCTYRCTVGSVRPVFTCVMKDLGDSVINFPMIFLPRKRISINQSEMYML